MSAYKTYKCDICGTNIKEDEMHVFAGVYGLDFHLTCLQSADGTIIGMFVDDVHVGNSREFRDRPNHAQRIHWNKWALLVGAFIGLILVWVDIAWWDNFHG